MKTFSAKPTDVAREWLILDASTMPLGRLSTVAASLLLGKHKPMFTKHIDTGDYVIILNADKLVVTGGKETKKMYYRHSGFPGGIKQTSLRDLHEKDPTAPITKAVRGMLPVNRLRDERLKRLKVYAGTEHGHEAQKPTVYEPKETK
jgi:large subunit ribosomal protein L13